MRKEKLMEEILDLSLDERIELVGDVWNAIAANPEDLPTPERHLDELERRISCSDAADVECSEVRERLRETD